MAQLRDPKPARPRFTATQGQYLAYIWTYTLIHRRAPAESDMQRFFCVSPPTVHQMVLTLERLGLITRTPRVARSIQVSVDPDSLPKLLPVEPMP